MQMQCELVVVRVTAFGVEDRRQYMPQGAETLVRCVAGFDDQRRLASGTREPQWLDSRYIADRRVQAGERVKALRNGNAEGENW